MTPKGEEWAVASEDCAFGPIGFKRVRDVLPGEMIVIDPEGKLHSKQCVAGKVRFPPPSPHTHVHTHPCRPSPPSDPPFPSHVWPFGRPRR